MHALAAVGTDAPALDDGDGDASALRAWLAPRIAAMLDGDRARLMAILYRVDVRERDVMAALSAPDPAGALADAIVARAMDAQRTRRAHAQSGTNRKQSSSGT